ncbi:hypothetical protein BMF94_4659 [Rhodotorula taiwanensis]|uniref:Uncharacterized protein n=1 Tax=Rhodotorula taiwanensis TaxID=741276 RepID=A0A2S5B6F7_9BASI|nr:hypothetical protein BMF94_4659 [Rhodotorula taiwanensis]
MAHPTVGGKGLPPVVSAPVYLPSSPATSTAGYGGYLAASSSKLPSYYATTAGPPPDLTARLQLKAKYARIQARYNRAIEARRDLTIELEEKEATQQRLQDEVDLILDQIHDSDYAHLIPKRDSLFSDDEGDDEGEENGDEANGAGSGDDSGLGANGTTEGATARTAVRKGKRKADDRDLDDLEDQRRRQLEVHYGIDGTRQNVSRIPTPPPQNARPPAAAPTDAPVSQQPASAPAVPGSIPPPQSTAAQTPAPAPTRIKLKFGGGGGSSAAGPA